MSKEDTKNGGIGSKSKRGSISKRTSSMEEELLHRQALAMAIQQHQVSQRFDNGSMSRVVEVCISYALEQLPQKISKAVYLCATMISDGQRPFDVFAGELGSAELFSPVSKSLIYGNGKDNPQTGIMFEKQHLHGLHFNQSPTKDVALAMVFMRSIPLGPMMGKLSSSTEKYGTDRRFYIQLLEDNALSPDVQEKLARENPPEGVFKIKGSDHCPFFSEPQSLHKILLEIAQIP